jgi:beta-lactamase regulating signal transducer with metallopeptidase domain
VEEAGVNEAGRLLHDPVVFRLGLTLVHFLWQGAAFGLLALLVLLVLRRARPATRYLVLLAVLASMASSPVVTYSLTRREPKPPVLDKATIGRLMAETARVSARSKEEAAHRADVIPDRAREPLLHTSRAALLRAWRWVRLRLSLAVMLWAAGVLVLTLRLLLRWHALRRVRAQAAVLDASAAAQALAVVSERLRLRRAVRLLESALVRVPTLTGWLRPAILLPPCALTGLTPAQLEAVIAHEVAHVRRHDFLVNILQTVVETLLFYHPVVWWLSHRIRAEREQCCDDLAVTVCGDAVSYARALAEMERLRALEPALAATGGPLAHRVRRLLGRGPEIRPLAPWSSAALPALAVTFLLLAPALARVARASSLEGTLVYVEGMTPPGNPGYATHVLRGGAEWVIPQASLSKPRSGDDFSPASGEVLYNYGSCQGGVGIWKAHPDGSGPVELTRIEGLGGMNCGPKWSPDGTMIAFSHDNHVWVMNADGSGAHQVTDLADRQTGGKSWSPDSSRLLACDRFEGGAFGVTDNCGHRFTVDVRTGQVRVLPGATRGGGVWSPDGSMIAGTASEAAVVDGKQGEWDRVVLTDAESSRARVLFQFFVPDRWQSGPSALLLSRRRRSRAAAHFASGLTNLTWSPSGEKIAFLAKTPDDPRTPGLYDRRHPAKGNWDVFVCDVRTGRTTRITDDQIAQESITWWD